MSWTLTPNYNLKKIDYDTEENTWGDILNQNFDTLDSAIKAIANELTPVGTILGFHKNLTGVPTMLGTWVECNGQTLNDPDSSLNGQVIPDLNGGSRFLRGSATSGIQQDDAFQGHLHWRNANNYYERVVNTDVSGSNEIGAGSQAWIQLNETGEAKNDGVSGTPKTANETRPINMSVVWIMRVK